MRLKASFELSSVDHFRMRGLYEAEIAVAGRMVPIAKLKWYELVTARSLDKFGIDHGGVDVAVGPRRLRHFF